MFEALGKTETCESSANDEDFELSAYLRHVLGIERLVLCPHDGKTASRCSVYA